MNPLQLIIEDSRNTAAINYASTWAKLKYPHADAKLLHPDESFERQLGRLNVTSLATPYPPPPRKMYNRVFVFAHGGIPYYPFLSSVPITQVCRYLDACGDFAPETRFVLHVCNAADGAEILGETKWQKFPVQGEYFHMPQQLPVAVQFLNALHAAVRVVRPRVLAYRGAVGATFDQGHARWIVQGPAVNIAATNCQNNKRYAKIKNIGRKIHGQYALLAEDLPNTEFLFQYTPRGDLKIKAASYDMYGRVSFREQWLHDEYPVSAIFDRTEMELDETNFNAPPQLLSDAMNDL